MLVLSTKPLQKLTGTDGQANLCVGRLCLQKSWADTSGGYCSASRNLWLWVIIMLNQTPVELRSRLYWQFCMGFVTNQKKIHLPFRWMKFVNIDRPSIRYRQCLVFVIIHMTALWLQYLVPGLAMEIGIYRKFLFFFISTYFMKKWNN